MHVLCESAPTNLLLIKLIAFTQLSHWMAVRIVVSLSSVVLVFIVESYNDTKLIEPIHEFFTFFSAILNREDSESIDDRPLFVSYIVSGISFMYYVTALYTIARLYLNKCIAIFIWAVGQSIAQHIMLYGLNAYLIVWDYGSKWQLFSSIQMLIECRINDRERKHSSESYVIKI